MQSVTLHLLKPTVNDTDTDRTEVFLGSWSLHVQIARPAPEELHMPLEVFLKWPLFPGQRVGLWETPDRRRLHLGPVIGIIWDGRRNNWWSLLRELGEDAQATGAVPVFFSLLDANLENEFLPAALCAGAHGDWTTRACPLPDVIYDRGTYPERKARQLAHRQRGRLTRIHDIPFINGVSAFNKWDTFRTLAFFDDTQRLCPETELLQNRAGLIDFLGEHRHIFLKNTWGTWGRDVVSIDAGRFSEIQLSGYIDGRHINLLLPGSGHLWHWIEEHCHRGEWIIQRAIDRQTLDGRVFDFRTVLQKDDHGTWRIPHVLINWAKSGELVSNRPKTSEFLTAEEFHPRWRERKNEFDELTMGVQNVSLLVAEALETRYGRLGELGLDVAVDKHGQAWLLEANAKPYFQPGESTQLPYVYARHLAKAEWTGKYAGVPALTQTGGAPWNTAHELT